MATEIKPDSTFLIRLIDLNSDKIGSLQISYEKCLDMVDGLEEIDVDEVACLIDFGVDEKTVLSSLENLNVVRILSNPKPLRAS